MCSAPSWYYFFHRLDDDDPSEREEMINDILIGIAWFGALLAVSVGGYCTGAYLQLKKKQDSEHNPGNEPIQDKS